MCVCSTANTSVYSQDYIYLLYYSTIINIAVDIKALNLISLCTWFERCHAIWYASKKFPTQSYYMHMNFNSELLHAHEWDTSPKNTYHKQGETSK